MLKINDKVIQINRPELGVGVILGITHDPEALYSIDFPFLRCTRREYQLKPYKEMQEERNIILTLDKAKEWYKKGGELREIALQAFSEKELNPLPRSWKEFCDQYSNINDTEYFIDNYSNIERLNDVVHNHCRLMNTDKNICPSKKSAEAHLAMIQLEQLRNCWWSDWKPIWGISQKWCIRLFNGVPSVGITTNISTFLTFPTKEMAYEFLNCFRSLIEQAGDLI